MLWFIFADEPTGLLGRRTELQAMAQLRGYCGQANLVAVKHNSELLSEADLVITLRDSQGAGIQDRFTCIAQGSSA